MDTATPCVACVVPPSRRQFLRDAAVLVTAAAGVFPIGFASAATVVGDEAHYPIPPQDGATIDRDHAAILVRWQGVIYAFVLWCPHQHTPVGWQEDAHQFECPKHHSQYQPNGMFIQGRATRGMDRYALRREGDTIVVVLTQVYQQDTDRAAWDAATVKL